MKRLALLVPLALLLSACLAVIPRPEAPQQLFWQRLNALCGRSYPGRVVSTDNADSEMAASRLVMHVTTCTPQYVRVAFHVGADRSRTWVIGRTATGLRLKHYHRNSEGVEDVRSQYGGDTVNEGSAFRQSFPTDAFSRALFIREGIPESNANIWSIEIAPGRMFGYELRRAGRFFRVEFDLTRTVPPPPPAWGPR